jgi:hypothetical protein
VAAAVLVLVLQMLYLAALVAGLEIMVLPALAILQQLHQVKEMVVEQVLILHHTILLVVVAAQVRQVEIMLGKLVVLVAQGLHHQLVVQA